MFSKPLVQLRKNGALVHNITNYVTVNDCANALLAIGASPIMADDIAEVEEIISICGALVINIGTLNERTIASMIAAGKKANALGKPVVLDPVGAGASTLRTQTVFKLLNEVKFAIIRGNISEIKTVYAGTGSTQGVDANAADALSKDNEAEVIAFAKELAKRTGAVIAITGAVDLIADSENAYFIYNGHPAMSQITGTGCMLTALLGAFAAANTEDLLQAAVTGVSFMGVCGEVAAEKVNASQSGTSSLRMHLIDAMGLIQPEQFMEVAKIVHKG